MQLKFKNPPGTYLYTGEKAIPTTIKHIQYNPNEFYEFDELQPLQDHLVDWIVVEGLHQVHKIRDLCLGFNVDPLIIEDILNVNQRNKIEYHNDYIFSVIKYSFIKDGQLTYDYISTLLFTDKIITFTEDKNNFLEDVKSRIINREAPIKYYKHSYLFYVLYDLVVDEELNVLSQLTDDVLRLEDDIMTLGVNDQVKLYHLRKHLIILRNFSDAILNHLFKDEAISHKIFEEKIYRYFEDLKDHVLQLEEKARTQLELIRSLFEIYSNQVSNKMNSIMTTLTIFSAIFIPLSFIAGVFGMNFKNFNILDNPYGIWMFIGISLIIPSLMLVYFKRKKWF